MERNKKHTKHKTPKTDANTNRGMQMNDDVQHDVSFQ